MSSNPNITLQFLCVFKTTFASLEIIVRIVQLSIRFNQYNTQNMIDSFKNWLTDFDGISTPFVLYKKNPLNISI